MATSSWLYPAPKKKPAITGPDSSLGLTSPPAMSMRQQDSQPQVGPPSPLVPMARNLAAPPSVQAQPASDPTPDMIRSIWSQPAQAQTGFSPYVNAPKHQQSIFTGGAFGQPTPNITDQDLALARQIGIQGNAREAMLADINQRPTEGGSPLGLAPSYNNPEAFAAGMSQQNPGRQFGVTLPSMITSSSGQVRPGFLSGPVPDLAQKPSFPQGLYRRDDTGSLVPASNGQVQLRTAAAQKFNASPDRKSYLDSRKASLASRREKVQAKSQARTAQRQERIQMRKGLTFEQRLAAANPAASQGRKAIEARLNGEQADRDLRLGLAEKQIAAERDNVAATNASRERIAALEGGSESKPPQFMVPPSAVGRLQPADYQRIASLDREEAKQALRGYGFTTDAEINAVLGDMFGAEQPGFWGGVGNWFSGQGQNPVAAVPSLGLTGPAAANPPPARPPVTARPGSTESIAEGGAALRRFFRGPKPGGFEAMDPLRRR